MAEQPATLIGEYFSPWTEKARWALDHHRVPYVYREHVPVLGEPLLRIRARRLTGRVSVPLLVTSAGPIPDSLQIAERAESLDSGSALFPAGQRDAIVEWNRVSERALTAARISYLERVADSPAAKVEMQPAFLPGSIRRASVPAADVAIAFLRRKYGVDGLARERAESEWKAALDVLDGALARGRKHLLDTGFSYADVTMAVTLQFIAPVDPRFIELGPATRASCCHPGLASRYADLLAWRDALYEAHRKPAGP